MSAARPWLAPLALTAGSLVALAGFTWPLLASAVPSDAQAATPVVAMALVPAAIVALALALDRDMHSAKAVALLGVLAAIGAGIRIAGAGVGGIEAVFILLILAGRAYGPRFGFLLGLLTIAVSSLLWGGLGPWTAFQMFGCAWVAAGAGLLPRIRPRLARASASDAAAASLAARAARRAARLEIAMLAGYGVVASYVFGLLMNIWFWPFAVGTGTGISYEAGAPIGTNLASFALYSLVSSTLTWDTVRAVTTLVGILLLGPAVLAALRRAKLPAR
ncbi:energy-coupling factor transport system substrate-specific component [Microterricola gilva]|uniref:Energy-coupling factor transport system substrate-specific component n=1 Tax=Microterricola gilva TaxID=393267 RepID=A0A4Q8ANP0_9MICO|nr:ECF transporter S component [Microterricola gilva]RZU65569.1 energy-coupling factor transport system substrate-specific component [Microterricola gilva]